MYRKEFLSLAFVAFLATIILIIGREKYTPAPNKENSLENIDEFNASKSEITSISCDISAVGSKTEIVYLKPSKSMSATTSLFGKRQAEVSTDGKDYWFWMKDFDKNSIYHCPLSQISSTRVILPMRPNIITAALGVDEIRWESTSVREGILQLTSYEDDLAKCTSFRDGKITEVAYYKNTLPVVTISFKSHQKINGFEVPKNVVVLWHEEKKSLSFEIRNIVLNIKKPPEIKMPEGIKKINLIDF